MFEFTEITACAGCLIERREIELWPAPCSDELFCEQCGAAHVLFCHACVRAEMASADVS